MPGGDILDKNEEDKDLELDLMAEQLRYVNHI